MAKWATELRCPKTLYCRVEEASGANQVVKWARDDVDGDMFVIPGLVAATALVLEPGRDELSPVWLDTSFEVDKGWWLARGVARRTRTLGQSPPRVQRGRRATRWTDANPARPER